MTQSTIVATLMPAAAFGGANRYPPPPVLLFPYLLVSSRQHLVSWVSRSNKCNAAQQEQIDSPAKGTGVVLGVSMKGLKNWGGLDVRPRASATVVDGIHG